MKTKILLSVLCVGSILFASAQTTINVPEDYETIQEAINAASDGDTVQVSPGTYVENIDFMEKAITVSSLYDPDDTPDSSFIFNTIIDGSQPLDPDKGSVVTITNVGDTTAVLSGFTIKHGSGTYKNGWRHGGGIYCLMGAKIIHNIIESNYVDQGNGAFGGGIYAAGSGALPYFVLKDNIIKNNNVNNPAPDIWGAYGGGVACKTSTCSMKNNTIACNEVNGWASGCGVFLWLCTGVIEKNSIYENTGDAVIGGVSCIGGGIFVFYFYSGLEIKNNEINKNKITAATTRGGGIGIETNGFCEYNKILIDGNVIRYNAADRGGGLYLETSYMATVSNNVIQKDTAYSSGGGIILRDQSVYRGIASDAATDNKINTSRGSGTSMPLLVNNTITDNKSNNGGGIANYLGNDAGFVAFNNIIYGNTAYNEIYLTASSPAYLYNNLLYTDSVAGSGTWQGADNILGDPCLCDDLIHLEDYSCCKDMGLMTFQLNDTTYTSPEYDIDGESRPNGGVDIGADEWYFNPNPGTLEMEESIVDLLIFPNPFTTSTTLSYTLDEPSTVTISIFNPQGQLIEKIEQEQPLGDQQVIWNAVGLPAGVYYFRIQVGDKVGSGKMVLMR